MTYRELLACYKNGTLEDTQKAKVESDIERQEAIADYLYEKEEIPQLDGWEGQDQASQEPDIKTIQKAIHRAFVRMGVIVGAVVFAIMLVVVFVLPQAVSLFYYNPNECVGNQKNQTVNTSRMSLDLAVYSEMFLPGAYRNCVNASAKGYGAYDISIPQVVSYTGRGTTVNGTLVRGTLKLYNTDVLKAPAGNVFVMPQELEEHLPIRYADEETKENWGAAGTKKEADQAIDQLDGSGVYAAFVSLEHLMDYADFYAWMKEQDDRSAIWCAVYLSDQNGDMCSGTSNIGMQIQASGGMLDWDRDRYPYLQGLDSQDPNAWDLAEDPEKMQTHFLSMLRYLNDHPAIMEMLHGPQFSRQDYEAMTASIKRDGIRIYGFYTVGKKKTLKALRKLPEVSYIYTTQPE